MSDINFVLIKGKKIVLPNFFDQKDSQILIPFKMDSKELIKSF